jgi:hypothetical protein
MKAKPRPSRWDDLVEAAPAAGLDEVETRAMNDELTRRRHGDSIFQSLMRLWPGDGRRPQASARAMAKLRAAFRASVSDLVDGAETADEATRERVGALLRHVVHARHPQDLWHLRTAIYTEVARAFDQAEAEARLLMLNRHLEQGKSLLRRLLS